MVLHGSLVTRLSSSLLFYFSSWGGESLAIRLAPQCVCTIYGTYILSLMMYSTAACIKIFQLLLGEVNDCTDWRVSNTLVIFVQIRLMYQIIFSCILALYVVYLYIPLHVSASIYSCKKISPTALENGGVDIKFSCCVV